MSSSTSVSVSDEFTEFSDTSNGAIKKVIELNEDIHSIVSFAIISVVRNKASSDMSSSEEAIDLEAEERVG